MNTNNQLLKELLKYLGWILLSLVFLWFKGCSNNEKPTQTVKVETPETKGTFEAKKPIHVQINKKNNVYIKGDNVYIKNPQLIAENEKLKADFKKANDSIKELKFNKAIQLNKFSTKFEDDNLILNIDGIVQGEVKEITPNYSIKAKKVDVVVKQKETVFRLLTGAGIGVNQELNKLMFKADVSFQNKSGNMISIEYLNMGSDAYGVIGFKKSIFNIKK